LYHWRVCQYHGFRSGAGTQTFPPAADKRRKADGDAPKAETIKTAGTIRRIRMGKETTYGIFLESGWRDSALPILRMN